MKIDNKKSLNNYPLKGVFIKEKYSVDNINYFYIISLPLKSTTMPTNHS